MIKRMFIATACVLLVASFCVEEYSYAGDASASGFDNRIVLLETVRQNYLASLRLEALKTKNTRPAKIETTGSIEAWLKRVKAEEVNMVTNRYVGKTQNEVKVSGKAYFVSGESYVWALQQNPSVRFAKDPFTNKIIDKADATIFVDASGRVLYFESDDAHKSFMALAERDTVFGYTAPK